MKYSSLQIALPPPSLGNLGKTKRRMKINTENPLNFEPWVLKQSTKHLINTLHDRTLDFTDNELFPYMRNSLEQT